VENNAQTTMIQHCLWHTNSC